MKSDTASSVPITMKMTPMTAMNSASFESRSAIHAPFFSSFT